MRMPGGRKGSIALETAIALPLFLFFAMSILQYLVAAGSVSLLRSATDNAASETALLMAAAEAAEVDDVVDTWIREQIGDAMAAERLRDFGTRLLAEVFLEERMVHWLEAAGAERATNRLLDHFSACIESTLSGDTLYARVEYQMTLLAGSATGAFDALIPFSPQSNACSQGGAGESDPVWEMDNFSRGRVFRTRNGGNLPMGYPVIASFRDGVATSIRSMDITAPSLGEEGAVWAEVRDEIDALRDFEGTDKPWGKESIVINSGDIRHRVLLLILPENQYSAVVEEQLDQATNYAVINGIELAVLRQGVSHRFE